MFLGVVRAFAAETAGKCAISLCPCTRQHGLGRPSSCGAKEEEGAGRAGRARLGVGCVGKGVLVLWRGRGREAGSSVNVKAGGGPRKLL